MTTEPSCSQATSARSLTLEIILAHPVNSTKQAAANKQILPNERPVAFNETLFVDIAFTPQYLLRSIYSATVRTTTPLRFDRPKILFEGKPAEYDATTPSRSWDATSDGRRLLLTKNVESTDKPVSAIHIVLNWTEELRQRVK